MWNRRAQSRLPEFMTPKRYTPMMVLTLALTLTACDNAGQPEAVGSVPAPLPQGSASQSPEPGEPSAQQRVTTQDVLVKGLRAPWAVAFLPDGTALVTERDSKKIKKVAQSPGHDAPYAATDAGVIDEADPSGEGGLMGIAVSPNYAQDQTIFLYYTSSNDNRIARWRIGGRPEPIVTDIPISGIHNGGRLAFGPDGFLYATTGDAGTRGIAQDTNSLGGKVLRMTMDGKPAPGNPFNNLVWSYGHRNVQGLGWDAWGRLWATEFGSTHLDEINIIEPGKNYGWPQFEGAGNDPRFKDPVFAFPVGESSCSGMAISNQNVLVAACLRGQRLLLVPIGKDGPLVSQAIPQLVREYGRLRAVVNAPDRSLWFLTNNHDGRCTSNCKIHPDDDRIVRITVGP